MNNYTYNPKNVIKNRQEIFLGLLVLFFLIISVVSLYISPTIGFYSILIFSILVAIITTTLSYGLNLFILVFIIYIRLSDIAVHEFDLPSILQPLIIIIMGIVVIRFVATGQKIQGWMRPLFPIMIYAMSLLISSFFADDFERAKEVLIDFVPNILLVICIVILLQKKEDIRIIIYGLISAGILLGTISIIQVGFGFYAHDFAGFGSLEIMNIVNNVESNRIGGSIGDPNIYAQIILVIIPIAFDRMINEKKLVFKLIAAWGFFATLLTVFFSYSRGAFVALTLMIIFYIIVKKIKMKYLFLGIIIIGLLIPFLPANYLDRLMTIPQSLPFFGNSVKNEVSYSGRWSEMITAILMFLDNPILGVGVNNYKYNYLEYARQIGTDLRGTERNPHILYLQVLAEQGIIGFIAFALIIFMIFSEFSKASKSFKNIKEYQLSYMVESLMIGFFGWLMAAFFLHLAYPRYFWLIYGIAFATNKIPNLYPYIFSKNKEL